MNFSDLFLTMAQTTEIQQTSLFPFPFGMHLVFCCVSLIFFVLRFVREKAVYQLIMAIAIPFSMIIWLSADSKTLFYAVGIAEALFLLSAFVTSIVYGKKESAAETASENVEEVPEENQSEEE